MLLITSICSILCGCITSPVLQAKSITNAEYQIQPKIAQQLSKANITVATTAPSNKYSPNIGPNYSGKVVLTFDDCPVTIRSYRKVINWAKVNNVGLVLAPTGDCVAGHLRKGADIVALARAQGQYVINHSESHADLTRLSFSSIVGQIGGQALSNYGRPPYGAVNATVQRAYQSIGMKIWLWTVDTNDWRGKSQLAVISYVVQNSHRGDTVLMHMQHQGFSVSALQAMVTGLAKKKVQVCGAFSGTTTNILPDHLPC